MTRQMAFDLPVRAALGRADFFVSPANRLALATLDRGDWPEGKLLLVGPEGAGKSHLARVWARDAGARILDADRLPAGRLVDDGALAIEDVDRIAGDREAETALFHLHNHVLSRRGRLLMTARSAPSGWPFALADLRSRIRGTALIGIEPPDDALLSAVLVKLFADRQIRVTPQLIEWLVRRIERSFAAARDAVAALDAAALRRGVPVSRRLAAELLDSDRAAGP
ncbi:P-loop NTPase family protein [Albidovulum sp.]